MNIIGNHIQIKDASNKSLIGKTGFVYYETKNTIKMFEDENKKNTKNYMEMLKKLTIPAYKKLKKITIMKTRKLKW